MRLVIIMKIWVIASRIFLVTAFLLFASCSTGPVPKPDTSQKLNNINRYTVIFDYVQVRRLSGSFSSAPTVLVDMESSINDRLTYLEILSSALKERGYEVGGTASSSGLFEVINNRQGVRYFVAEASTGESTEGGEQKLVPASPPFFMDKTITENFAAELNSVVDKVYSVTTNEGTDLTIPEAVIIAKKMDGNPMVIFYCLAETVTQGQRIMTGLFGPFAGPHVRLQLRMYVIEPETGELIWADGMIKFVDVDPKGFRKLADLLLDKLPDKGVSSKGRK